MIGLFALAMIYLNLFMAIATSDCVYDFDRVLTTKAHFFRFIFQFQVFVLGLEEYYDVNHTGIVLAEILVTILVFPMNILLFIVLSICEIVRFGFYWFLKMFAKERERK